MCISVARATLLMTDDLSHFCQLPVLIMLQTLMLSPAGLRYMTCQSDETILRNNMNQSSMVSAKLAMIAQN